MRRRFGHRNLILYLSLSGLCLQASAEYQRLPKAIQPSELAQARQLHKQGEYYAALQRLEPVITAEHGGDTQEEALWLANTLCEKLVRYNILVKWVDNAFGDRTLEGEFRSAEPYLWLNNLGANIRFDQVTAAYSYHYGFLEMLVRKYPESSYMPAAKYYLIPREFNDRNQAEAWGKALSAYLDTHENPELPERIWAQLDLARIHDTLWELISYPSDFSSGFTTGDAVGDRAYAATCRDIALKNYLKVLESGLEGRFGMHPREYIQQRYSMLKEGIPEKAIWGLYE